MNVEESDVSSRVFDSMCYAMASLGEAEMTVGTQIRRASDHLCDLISSVKGNAAGMYMVVQVVAPKIPIW